MRSEGAAAPLPSLVIATKMEQQLSHLHMKIMMYKTWSGANDWSPMTDLLYLYGISSKGYITCAPLQLQLILSDEVSASSQSSRLPGWFGCSN